MRFISGGIPLTGEVISSITQRSRALWDEYGYGPWAALDAQTGRWVGRIGLNLLHDWPGPDKWEVGFELAPEYWGCGLATEGARGPRFRLDSDTAGADHQRHRRRAPRLAAGHGKVRSHLPSRNGLAGEHGRLVRHRPAGPSRRPPAPSVTGA
jgi:hypothetical protein